jgi:hypothetical protein
MPVQTAQRGGARWKVSIELVAKIQVTASSIASTVAGATVPAEPSRDASGRKEVSTLLTSTRLERCLP